jgi:hypothetical protein
MMQDGTTKETENDQPDTNTELVDSDIQQTEEIMRVNPTQFPFPDLLPLTNKQNETTNFKEVEMTEPNNYGVENIKSLYTKLAETTYSAINALGDGFQVKDLTILIPLLPELFSIGSEINKAKLELGDVITKEEEESLIVSAIEAMPFENGYDKELVGLITKQVVGIQQIWHNRAMKAAELKAQIDAGAIAQTSTGA